MFGAFPDFLIVLDKDYWDTCGPRLREVLVYHELLHAAHARDKYDAPKFDKEGRPCWAIRGHDVEEFAETVRRYGAWHEGIERLVEAAAEHGA
ncbi:hypothetical protein AWB80_08438 [Caballeronia pedi]|uniref:Putative phage metallopeptidase domain-containing protein n=2 Tax=Caballeronia pedi TaxID=1777141 RepID=A0A158E7C7_9BURK|nr:hypothetical protein AWB80_08438 [Caballeronia pedi]